ncbi:MAG TPA: alpha/beta hydrolase-fold protein [Vitreimonas sp.]|uniref:alpha/beta hydrolase n=1 Tax=Vitreimonas sp. TaxID=3069702 RepID=UPI002D2ED4A0|nr:alpha/beta hydrolase-fold protein [Vitreimonas sp.]HYD86676.1 alpha/beta hydrolase-fold protein [Vitreimonas sp.]
MRRRWLIAAALALVVMSFAAYHLIAPRSHVLLPPRASNGVEYVLYIHVPDACRRGGCQALYLLDGERWLPTFARIVDEGARTHRIEPVVIVGVGYRDIVGTAARRKHDFTPPFGRTPNRTGGAEAYLDVLRNEIIPYAEARLPITRERRAIAGHSYGGLFATYALQRAPNLFDRYAILSPALWFDDGKIFQQTFAESHRLRAVFLAADTPPGERSAMASDMVRLSELLAGRPGLVVSAAILAGETHDSMVAPAASRATEALFGLDPHGAHSP